jgi:hypothetical protein
MKIFFLDVLWDADGLHLFEEVVLCQHTSPVVIVLYHVEKRWFVSIGNVLESKNFGGSLTFKGSKDVEMHTASLSGICHVPLAVGVVWSPAVAVMFDTSLRQGRTKRFTFLNKLAILKWHIKSYEVFAFIRKKIE